jgi:hypothetical protein
MHSARDAKTQRIDTVLFFDQLIISTLRDRVLCWKVFLEIRVRHGQSICAAGGNVLAN